MKIRSKVFELLRKDRRTDRESDVNITHFCSSAFRTQHKIHVCLVVSSTGPLDLLHSLSYAVSETSLKVTSSPDNDVNRYVITRKLYSVCNVQEPKSHRPQASLDMLYRDFGSVRLATEGMT